jgi:hypothetical protein
MAMARPDFAASAEGAEHGSAGLTAEDSVPYEVVVATIDALRRTQAGTPLLPVVQFFARPR